jgi:hypothetical protein
VERAKGDEVGPVLFERNIAADDIDNIARRPDLFERGGRKEAAHSWKEVYFLPGVARISSIS